MLFEKPLFEWKKPKALKFKLSDAFLYLKYFLRAYLVALVISILTYAYLRFISTDEFDKMWDDIFIKFILGSAGLILLMFAGGVIQSFLDFTKYAISEKGIHSSGTPNWFLKWPKIKGFWIEPSKTNKEIQMIYFLAGKRRRSIPLSQDKALCEQIIQTISQRLPQIEPMDNSSRLTISNSQGAFLAILTLVYCYLLISLCYPCFFNISKGWIAYTQGIFFMSSLILGPGTIGMAILSKGKWSEFRKDIHYAQIINMVAFILIMFLLMLIGAKLYLEQAGM